MLLLHRHHHPGRARWGIGHGRQKRVTARFQKAGLAARPGKKNALKSEAECQPGPALAPRVEAGRAKVYCQLEVHSKSPACRARDCVAEVDSLRDVKAELGGAHWRWILLVDRQLASDAKGRMIHVMRFVDSRRSISSAYDFLSDQKEPKFLSSRFVTTRSGGNRGCLLGRQSFSPHS